MVAMNCSITKNSRKIKGFEKKDFFKSSKINKILNLLI